MVVFLEQQNEKWVARIANSDGVTIKIFRASTASRAAELAINWQNGKIK